VDSSGSGTGSVAGCYKHGTFGSYKQRHTYRLSYCYILKQESSPCGMLRDERSTVTPPYRQWSLEAPNGCQATK